MRIGLIGKDGRTSAIAQALAKSPHAPEITVLSEWKPSSDVKMWSKEAALEEVLKNARKFAPDFVVVGPEEPLEAGVVDELDQQLGIPCIGPTQKLAQLESSKSFTRRLLSRHSIPGNPRYEIFQKPDGIAEYLSELTDFVIKPDGLTGGKGVRISGEHIKTVEKGVQYASDLFQKGSRAVVIEEKLEGEEFSLQSFCDGRTVRHMVLVQDHKRAREADEGANTGGMGSYSCPDHGLPFLRNSDVDDAKEISSLVVKKLYSEIGPYKGIVYGGFMATREGVRVLEYNARFGDPEALNVLSILKSDLVDIFQAIIKERLHDTNVEFGRLATVCKYVVPQNYPESPVRDQIVDLSQVPAASDQLKIYHAAIDRRNNEYYLSGSRAIAFVGIASSLEGAEAIAEEAASSVRGPVFHRRDIGTTQLVNRRVRHMENLRTKKACFAY
jgi:phosphoribosylamine--glycine ligase